ncbi:toll/interleukin-1 receptor domain-containing protein [Clostridium sp. VAP41]|uniref:toll/interleukin-1 receptor domain-containing protein n=1 Tax=Clostridium sp. VAP41 TaxID=2949979 RepID=UPI002079413E|nr:toll/interleukin-1 receptor domain-containing protein [Clostridium sp. VAP41]
MEEEKRIRKTLEILDLISIYIDDENKANEYFNAKATLYDLFFINHQIRDAFTDIIPTKDLIEVSSFLSSLCASRALNSWEINKIKASVLKIRNTILNSYRKESEYMKKIFISHSTKDVALIEKFLDFLETGMGINREEVYCTSVDGTISTGQKFIDNIEKNIRNSQIVIFIITPQYMQSKFCLAEMGAAWVLNQQIYPLIFNPLDFDVLEDTPLKGIQAKILNSEKNILSMYDELKKKEIAKDKPVTLLSRKSQNFIKELNEITEKYSDCKEESDGIKDLKLQNEELLNVIDDKDNKIKKLNNYISKLAKTKDKEQVLDLQKDSLDNYNKFNEMVKELEKQLNRFSAYVTTCIFICEFRNEVFRPNITDSLSWKEVDECVIDGELERDGNQIYLNSSNVSICLLVEKLKGLDKFIEEMDEETFDILTEEYSIENLDMRYRPFWTKVLRQKINI